jgi:hypothetical protein
MADAPLSCPVSFGQIGQAPSSRRVYRDGQPRPIPLPVIPPAQANDVPSLIRTVNMITDVLRQLTSDLVVNNLYLPKAPFFRAEGNTYYSEYPLWDQQYIDTVTGYVYHHDKDGSKDKDQKVKVQRQNMVTYLNRMQDDPEFKWSYFKPLDETLG